MKVTPIAFLILLCNLLLAQNDVSKTSTPDWVILNDESTQTINDPEGASYYQLFEVQENIPKSSSFVHYTVRLNNEEGLQNYSDIQVEFDPEYQVLQFHSLAIYRGSEKIDLLASSTPKIIQREESLERAIYNGRLTAIFNLEGLIEGDVIDYSYSLQGSNPVHKGNYSDVFYQEFGIPVGRIYYRLISSNSDSLYFTYPEGGLPPLIEEKGNFKEYIWDFDKPNVVQFDSNLPSWYDPQKRAEVSTFKNWKDVVNWALPLYKYNRKSINKILNQTVSDGDVKKKVTSLIRMVQDEIRYLGFEEGISAFKPHSPDKVYKQKYGDCKDKSLLLSALLSEIGVNAYPMLVNSTYGENIIDGFKSYQAFDHCVVAFEMDDKQYFVDPTISNQGGDMERNYFPDYRYGLIIRDEVNDLVEIPSQEYGRLSIEEYIKVDSIGGGASYNIISTYSGAKADDVRAYFNGNSLSDIEKGYLDYYSEIYPSISQKKGIEISDSLRDDKNIFVAKEYYLIEEFWSKMEDTMVYFTEQYPLVLSSELSFPSSPKRSMPFAISDPYEFHQKTVLILPENWALEPYNKTIENDFIKYQNSIYNTSNIVTIIHDYEVKKESVSAENYLEFRNSIDNIVDELTYTLTYDRNLLGFNLSRWSLFLTILITCLATYLLRRIYINFNPKSRLGDARPKDIGGIMILPILGLIYSFFKITIEFFGPDFFNANIWSVADSYGSSRSFAFKALLASEMFYNIFLVGFIILLLILFVKKRTSFPLLITVYYAAILIVPILDALAVVMILPSIGFDSLSESVEMALRALIGIGIWGTYFMVSQRSKETFVNTFTKV